LSTTAHDRAGVIVIRVWLEDASTPVPRARITATTDLASTEHVVDAAEGVDEILAAVRSWLDAFLAG
jgi:hypothetical protein